MKPFKLLWEVHKWIGLAIGVVLIGSALTGLLLLVKKDFEWIQPPTRTGTAAANPTEFRPLHEVFDAAFTAGVPQLRSMADVDRVDFRPDKGIHKIRSVHDHVEVQVDAVTLEVSPPGIRRSDWLEQLHDGSWFGSGAHDWFMPAFAVLLVVLSITGYLIWLWPRIAKAKRRAASHQTP